MQPDLTPAEQLLLKQPWFIDLDLQRSTDAARALGVFEANLPPVIHIGGTNGKGSTQAYLSAILQAAGYKVHAYTSPHLVKLHERFQIANEQITEEQLLDYGKRITALHPELSYFETLTMLAFKAFEGHPADVILLEVGCGGRLDTTNILPKVACSVFTPISLDHQEFLGDTVAAIAKEKAGIIKPDCPVVTAPQDPAALKVLQEEARGRGVPFTVSTLKDFNRYAKPGLKGVHQLTNASLAIDVLHQLQDTFPKVNEAAINEGLRKVKWSGRLQRLSHPGLPTDSEIWVDGAHNQAAAEELANSWEKGAETTLVVGIQKNRPVEQIIKPFEGKAQRLIALPLEYSREGGHAQEDIMKVAESCGMQAGKVDSFEEALKNIPSGSRILVMGSLYLVGNVLKSYGETT